MNVDPPVGAVASGVGSPSGPDGSDVVMANTTTCAASATTAASVVAKSPLIAKRKLDATETPLVATYDPATAMSSARGLSTNPAGISSESGFGGLVASSSGTELKTPDIRKYISTFGEWKEKQKAASEDKSGSAAKITKPKTPRPKTPGSAGPGGSGSEDKPKKPRPLKPKPPATGAIELTGAEGEPGSYEKTLVSSDQPSDGTLTVGAAVTPVVAKSVHSTSTAKKRPSTASKKKRIEELIERETTIKTNLEKLRKTRSKIEKQLEEVKFPVPDESIAKFDRKGPLPQTLPEPSASLPIANHLVGDALMVWNFLYTFGQEISLKPYELNDFIQLLTYCGDTSVALVETCTALMRTLIADTATCTNLIDQMPAPLLFSFRGNIPKLETSGGELIPGYLEGASGFTQDEFAYLSDSFTKTVMADSNCTGMKLFHARKFLRVDQVDASKWQAILRAIFPRLRSYRQLQREADLQGDLAASKWEFEGSDQEGYEQFNLDYKYNVTSTNTITMETTSETLRLVDMAYRANCDLQEMEFHSMSVDSKLIVLKLLCMACYECESVQAKIAQNAEARLAEIANVRKNAMEEKKKLREVSAAKRAEALQRCRDINRRAAEEALAASGRGSGKKNLGKKSVAPASGKAGDKGAVKKRLSFAGASDGGDDETAGLSTTSASVSAPSKKAGAKAAKDSYDPTPQQLQAMLDEMLMLDALGIDVVMPSAPELEPISDNEEDGVGGDVDVATRKLIAALTQPNAVASRSQSKGARERDRDRERRRVEQTQVRRARESASTLIEIALQSRRERDIKDALKIAKTAGFRGTSEDGSSYCTEELKKLYELQYSMDQEAKEAVIAQKLEKALSELYVRTEPVGEDRFGRKYWCFDGDDRLFVQTDAAVMQRYAVEIEKSISWRNSTTPNRKKASSGSSSSGSSSTGGPDTPSKKNNSNKTNHQDVSSAAYISSTAATASPAKTPTKSPSKSRPQRGNDHNNSSMTANSATLTVAERDPTTKLLVRPDNVPSSHTYTWQVYRSINELWALVEALDERGEREKALRSFIKAKFDLTGDPPGSDRRTVIGVVTGWLPAEGEDEALYHITHDDGDEEDLEEKELKRCIVSPLPPASSGALEGASVAEADDTGMEIEEMEGDRAAVPADAPQSSMPTRRQARASDGEHEWVDDGGATRGNSTTLDVEPDIVRVYVNSFRSGMAIKSFNIGPHATRAEFLRVFNLIQDGLRQKGSQFYRSAGRRVWENSLKNALTASDFRGALVELEQVVRDTQVAEDAKAEEEVEQMRREAQSKLEAEGWVFDAAHIAKSESYANAVMQLLSHGADGEGIESGDSKDSGSGKRKREASALVAATSKRQAVGADGSVKASENAVDSLTTLKELLPLLPSEPIENVSQVSGVMDKVLSDVKADIDGAACVGRRVRRFFRSIAQPSDATVISFLPAVMNDGIALWHLFHDDGDEEDLDASEVQRGMRAFETNLTSPEVEGVFDGEDEGSDEDGSDAQVSEHGSDSEAAGSEDGSFEEDEGSDGGDGEGEYGNPVDDATRRLWPSASIRAKWIAAVLECKTLSELGIALAVLADYCKDYGITTPDAAELARRAKVAEQARKARQQQEAAKKAASSSRSSSGHRASSRSGSSKKRRFSLTPMKPRSTQRGRDDYVGITIANRPRREVKKPDTFTVGHHTPHRVKMHKDQSRSHGRGSAITSAHTGGQSLFRDFNFFSDRPVREGRRTVNYAE